MRLEFKYTYKRLPFDIVFDAYVQCRRKAALTFDEVPGTHYECMTQYPVPRGIAPLLPWLKTIDLKEVGRFDATQLQCVVVNECSTTHMLMHEDGEGNTVVTAQCELDVTGWNPLVIAATPTLTSQQFKLHREREAKLARRLLNSKT